MDDKDPGLPRTIAAAANTATKLVDLRCKCFVCWLRGQVENHPSTKGTTFSDGELEVHLVGVRREGSFSDRFDDFLCMFFRPVAPIDGDAFTAAIEPELLDEWRSRAFKGAASRIKTVPCLEDSCIWIVALYDTFSTDPGLSAVPSLDAARKQKADADANVDKKQLAVTDAEAKRDENQRLATGGDKKAQGAVANREKDVKNANTALTAAIAARVKAAAALAKAENAVAAIGDDPKKGMTNGRAVMPCQAYPNAYALHVHQLTMEAGFATSHVALKIGYTENGYRLYSGAYIRSAEWATVKRGFITEGGRKVVGALIPAGAAKAEYFDGTTATLVEPDPVGGTTESSILTAAGKRAFADGDLLAMRGTIGGTNLHRGHNVKRDGDHLVSAGGGKYVKNWSEGCQVNQSFESYNQFIRVCGIAKRFACARSGKHRESCKLLEAGTDDALSPAEQLVRIGAGARTVRHGAAGKQAKDSAVYQELVDDTAENLDAEHDKLVSALAQQTKQLERALAANAKLKHPKDTEEVAPKVRTEIAASAAKIETNRAARENVAEPSPEAVAACNELVRDRTLAYATDFLRECDLRGACTSRFTYVLIALPDAGCDELVQHFDQERNKPWDGALVIGG